MEIINNSKVLKTKDCARIIDWLYRNQPIANPYLAEEVIVEDEEAIDIDDLYHKPISENEDGYWGEETTWYNVTTAYYIVGRDYYPLELKRSVKRTELIWFN